MTSRPDTVDTVAPASSADPAARDELFDLLNGYWRTQMLCTAAELGLADALAEGPATSRRSLGAPAPMPTCWRGCCAPWPGSASSHAPSTAGTPPPAGAGGWSVPGRVACTRAP